MSAASKLKRGAKALRKAKRDETAPGKELARALSQPLTASQVAIKSKRTGQVTEIHDYKMGKTTKVTQAASAQAPAKAQAPAPAQAPAQAPAPPAPEPERPKLPAQSYVQAGLDEDFAALARESAAKKREIDRLTEERKDIALSLQTYMELSVEQGRSITVDTLEVVYVCKPWIDPATGQKRDVSKVEWKLDEVELLKLITAEQLKACKKPKPSDPYVMVQDKEKAAATREKNAARG